MTGTLCQIGLLSRGGGVLPRVRNAGRRLPFRHHAADVFRGLNDEAARIRERVGRAARRARVLAADLPAVEARVAALDEGDLDVARAEKRDKSGEAARARNLLEPPRDSEVRAFNSSVSRSFASTNASALRGPEGALAIGFPARAPSPESPRNPPGIPRRRSLRRERERPRPLRVP